MRKLVILALILTFSAYSFAIDCVAGEVKDGDTCIKCTNTTVTGGIANCGACTYSATDKKLTCTACASNYFFSSTAKTACAQCAPACNGGNCADAATAEVAATTDCTKCVDNFLLVGAACKACVAGCTTCTVDASAVTDADKGCTTCSKGFFRVEASKSCTACDATCGACTAADVCSECKTEGQLLNRPVDDGKCVAADKCTGGVGSTSATVKICSKYAAPKPVVLNATSFVLNSTHANSLTLGNLCGPSSTVAADKEAEMVGALVANSVGDAGVTINDTVIYNARKAISDKVTADVFGKQNSLATVNNVNWLNIIGTKEGLATLEKFRVPKGNSVLNYICINSLNVPSAVQTVKINNNVTLNNAVRFALTFKRALNDTELNNLTCNVAKAIFPDNADAQLTVKNSNGKACVTSTPAATRILQTAATFADYYFEVPANQNDDTLEATVKGKLAAVKTAVTGFSNAVGAAVISEPVDVSTPQGVTFGVPAIVVTSIDKNATTVTYSINSTEAANVWIAVVATGQAVNDEIVRGSQNNVTLHKENFALDAKVALNKTAKNLTAAGSFELYYYAANKFDSSKNSKLQKVTITTGSAFSTILALGSFVLLVLALFI